MTATTSQKLADVLRAAGFNELADRAEADEFHDYLSMHDFPITVLAGQLAMAAQNPNLPEAMRTAAYHIRQRVLDDEFEASAEEAAEWAESDDGRETFRKLGEKL